MAPLRSTELLAQWASSAQHLQKSLQGWIGDGFQPSLAYPWWIQRALDSDDLTLKPVTAPGANLLVAYLEPLIDRQRLFAEVEKPLTTAVAADRRGARSGPLSRPSDCCSFSTWSIEASHQAPSPVGQTVTVVGGLIIGQAAVKAHLGSQLVVIVSAVTGIGTLLIMDLTLAYAARIAKSHSWWQRTSRHHARPSRPQSVTGCYLHQSARHAPTAVYTEDNAAGGGRRAAHSPRRRQRDVRQLPPGRGFGAARPASACGRGPRR